MLRYVFLLALLVPACGSTEVRVTKVTPEMRFGADVYVSTDTTLPNGNTWNGRQHGLKVGDRLVLTVPGMFHGREGTHQTEVLYTDRRGTERSVPAKIVAHNEELKLMLVQTEQDMDIMTASFMFIRPKVGTKVFTKRRNTLQEAIVQASEWYPDGIRFRVMAKGDEHAFIEHGEAVFDEAGRVLGIASFDAGLEKRPLNGHKKTSTGVFPSSRIWAFIKAGREKTKAP